jgi:hypothetical protein
LRLPPPPRAQVMLVRMLAWSAELAYRHECVDLVAAVLGNDELMDVVDVEGIRWAGGAGRLGGVCVRVAGGGGGVGIGRLVLVLALR